MKLLSRITGNLTVAIPVAMLLGLGYGLIAPTAWLRTLLVGGDGKAQLLAQAINFAVIPFVAFALGRLWFPEQPYFALGLLLASLLPTSGMTIAWTGFAKGNLPAAIR